MRFIFLVLKVKKGHALFRVLNSCYAFLSVDLDGEKMDTFCSPAKRFLAAYSPGGITSDRTHPMSHHILHR